MFSQPLNDQNIHLQNQSLPMGTQIQAIQSQQDFSQPTQRNPMHEYNMQFASFQSTRDHNQLDPLHPQMTYQPPQYQTYVHNPSESDHRIQTHSQTRNPQQAYQQESIQLNSTTEFNQRTFNHQSTGNATNQGFSNPTDFILQQRLQQHQNQ